MGAAAGAHTTKTMERVAADQGAMIGLTYRCFGLAARCDPVMRRTGCEWPVVGGLTSRVDLLEGRCLWAADWSCLVRCCLTEAGEGTPGGSARAGERRYRQSYRQSYSAVAVDSGQWAVGNRQ
jgi:hypothetical protein